MTISYSLHYDNKPTCQTGNLLWNEKMKYDLKIANIIDSNNLSAKVLDKASNYCFLNCLFCRFLCLNLEYNTLNNLQCSYYFYINHISISPAADWERLNFYSQWYVVHSYSALQSLWEKWNVNDVVKTLFIMKIYPNHNFSFIQEEFCHVLW